MILTTANDMKRVAFTDYDLVPMNSALAAYLEDLAQAMARGHFVPDPDRKDFFDIMAGNHWFYVHIEPAAGTAYLIAHQVIASS